MTKKNFSLGIFFREAVMRNLSLAVLFAMFFMTACQSLGKRDTSDFSSLANLKMPVKIADDLMLEEARFGTFQQSHESFVFVPSHSISSAPGTPYVWTLHLNTVRKQVKV